jgi:urease
VPLIAISGLKLVKGGNNLVDGEVSEENLKRTMKRIGKRGFGNRTRKTIEPIDIQTVNKEFGLNMPASWFVELPRDVYLKRYGPTVGDRVYLGDLNLVVEIERDFISHGDELTFGVGKSLREGQGLFYSLFVSLMSLVFLLFFFCFFCFCLFFVLIP